MSSNRTMTWVISLDGAGDRRKHFTEAAQSSGMPWTFFDAHRGLCDLLSYTPTDACEHKGRELTTGELGCYSSHYALWSLLVEDEHHDQYVILEDDVLVDWKNLEQIAARSFMDEDISYLRLYYKFPGRVRVWQRHYIHRTLSLVQLFDEAYGTQGYVITKAAARKFLDDFRVIRRPIDDEMDRYWEHGIPNLAIFPFPILERLSRSTIEIERFDALPRLSSRQIAMIKKANKSRDLAYRRSMFDFRAMRLKSRIARILRRWTSAYTQFRG